MKYFTLTPAIAAIILSFVSATSAQAFDAAALDVRSTGEDLEVRASVGPKASFYKSRHRREPASVGPKASFYKSRHRREPASVGPKATFYKARYRREAEELEAREELEERHNWRGKPGYPGYYREVLEERHNWRGKPGYYREVLEERHNWRGTAGYKGW